MVLGECSVIDIQPIISKVIEYLNVPATVGHEMPFMDYLDKDFQKLGLFTFKGEGHLSVSGPEPKSAVICAHIDRHGLISIGDGEYVYAAQYIKEIKYGENNRLAQQELDRIAKRFEGETIFAYDSHTGQRLGSGVIEACDPHTLVGDALFFVQGMPSMEAGVPVGYARMARYEDGILKGQIDNAISLAVVYELFRQGFQGTAIFAIEEEIGKSWIHIKACLEMEEINPQGLLVLDTSPFTEKDTIEKGCVILRNRDMSGEFNTALVRLLKDRCEDLELPFLVKDEVLLKAGKTVEQLGSTELGKLIFRAGDKYSGATVQIPTMMYHTCNETTTAAAIQNYFLLLRNILIEDKISMLETN